MPDYAKIGPTALVTAYAWHKLAMPYGQLFTTREGAAMFWAFHGSVGWTSRFFPVPSLLEYLEFRHRMMEAQLERMSPDRVIELGAGLSRRGITWALEREVPYVEIDLPHMTAAKRAMLAKAPGRVQGALHAGLLQLVSTDILAPGFADELARLLEGAKRPLIVSEGMLSYFSHPDCEKLLRNLVAGLRASGSGGHYLTDLERADRERKFGLAGTVFRQAIKLATKGQGPNKPFRDLEHVDRFFAQAGFDAGEELRPKALADLEPRLHTLRSPTTIWLARVDPR